MVVRAGCRFWAGWLLGSLLAAPSSYAQSPEEGTPAPQPAAPPEGQPRNPSAPSASAPAPEPDRARPNADDDAKIQPEAHSPSASPQVLEKARKRFKQGVALAQAGNCDAAIAEFQTSFRLVRRPNTLYNIAQCQERLFRYDKAIEYYERYLRLASAHHEDHQAVEEALRSLRKLLGHVRVESNVPAEIWIDGHHVGEAPGEILVPAGTHSVELRAEGRIPVQTEFQIAGREEATVSLQLEKAQTTIQVTERSGMSPVVFWIGATSTVVTAAVGGFFGTRALQLRADAESVDARLPERAEAKEDVDRAALLADIFFASAGVLAVGTTVAFFATDWGPEDDQATPAGNTTSRATLRWAPEIAEGYVGMQLRGTM